MQKFNEYMKGKMIFSYEISKSCNLRCSYCYMLKELNNKKEDIGIAKLVIDKLTEFNTKYPDIEIELDLLGGDPLEADLLFNFVEELSKIKISIWIVTNLVPNEKDKIYKLKELIKIPNVGVAATWHENINHNEFKENLLILKESQEKRAPLGREQVADTNLIASFVLFNENKQMMEKAKWLIENNIEYSLTHFYNNKKRVQYFEDWTEDTKFVFKNSKLYNYELFLDGIKLSPEEYEKNKYFQIANMNRVVCEPLNWNISFEGNIRLSCQMNNKHRYQYHISEGIKPKRIFCPGGDCYCSFYGYKEIHGRKNDS